MSTTPRVTFDHLSLPVADIARSRAFYATALTALGFDELEGEGYVAFGASGDEGFCLVDGDPGAATVHVAFRAASRAEVDAFHAAALAAGAKDNGAPGIREHYAPGYYAAFVLDPDGYNVEAVFHEPA